MEVTDLGPTELKNIARPIRAYSLKLGVPRQSRPAKPVTPAASTPRRWLCAARRRARGALVVRAARGGSSMHPARAPPERPPRARAFPSSCCPSPISAAIRRRITSPTR